MYLHTCIYIYTYVHICICIRRHTYIHTYIQATYIRMQKYDDIQLLKPTYLNAMHTPWSFSSKASIATSASPPKVTSSNDS